MEYDDKEYQEALKKPRQEVIEEARKLLGKTIQHPSEPKVTEFLEEQLYQGYLIELEHGTKFGKNSPANLTNNDTRMTLQIAWAHILEDPAYYYRLHNMEEQADHFLDTLRDGRACVVNKVVREANKFISQQKSTDKKPEMSFLEQANDVFKQY
jgi:tryptophan 2,3-dioxygenase